MKNRLPEVVLGGGVVIFIALLVVIGLRADDRLKIPTDHYILHAHFVRVGNLARHAPVLLAGMQVGKVVSVGIEPGGLGVDTTVAISRNVLLPTDTVVRIIPDGLNGKMAVSLLIGANEEYLAENESLQLTQDAFDIVEKIGRRLLRP